MPLPERNRLKATAVEVARPWKGKDANGNEVEITASMLSQACDNYDPAFEECVLAPDHKREGSSHGYAERFYMDGDRMLADLEGDADTIYEMRQGGKLSRRSMLFSTREGKEGWYPAHLAPLGAKPPAIKGLAPIKTTQMIALSEWDGKGIELYLAEPEDGPEEVKVATKTTALAADPTDEMELSELKQQAAKAKQLEVELAEKDKRLAALEDVTAELSEGRNNDRAIREIDALDAGRMTPAEKQVAVAMLSACYNGKNEIVLAADDGTENKLPLAAAFKEYVKVAQEARPPLAKDQRIKLAENPLAGEITLSEKAHEMIQARGFRPGTKEYDDQVKLRVEAHKQIMQKEAANG